ncbi:ABC-2 family transporter protein [Bartonella sp. 220]|uniref:ABC-2 family transporter protein n=1 Tax=Bartonella sp. 220B TaxID=2967260 RepID=UPI0022A97C66|nr:ABC-2 family transporter protein [Bartonella sp. 220B]MCZ2159128.1 ABC-2 family transporter protein [Bartonella sp. 220B]
MEKFLAYVSNSLKNSSAYKANLVGYIGLTFIVTLIRLFYADSIYQNTNSLKGWTLEEFDGLIFFMLVISLLLNTFASSINNFFYALLSGKLEPLLMQPVPLVYHMLLRWANNNNLLILLGLLVLGALYNIPKLDFTLLSITITLLTVLFAVISNLAFVTLLHSISLLSQKYLPVEYIHSEMFKLNLLPPHLFGTMSLIAIISFVPSLVGAGVTVTALLNPYSSLIYYYWLSTVICVITAWQFFRVLMKKRVSLGG